MSVSERFERGMHLRNENKNLNARKQKPFPYKMNATVFKL